MNDTSNRYELTKDYGPGARAGATGTAYPHSVIPYHEWFIRDGAWNHSRILVRADHLRATDA